MAKMGRPTKYNDKIAERICLRLSEGESLRKICEGKDMVSTTAVMSWLRDNQDFAARYARARRMQADRFFDKISAIREDVERGQLDPNAARVIIDALKWQACKLEPQRYGDKIQVEQDTSVTINVMKYTGAENQPITYNKPKEIENV
jgi:hypothetical protein